MCSPPSDRTRAAANTRRKIMHISQRICRRHHPAKSVLRRIRWRKYPRHLARVSAPVAENALRPAAQDVEALPPLRLVRASRPRRRRFATARALASSQPARSRAAVATARSVVRSMTMESGGMVAPQPRRDRTARRAWGRNISGKRARKVVAARKRPRFRGRMSLIARWSEPRLGLSRWRRRKLREKAPYL